MARPLKQKGFSILEMLIYISILVLMLAVVMNAIVAVTRSERLIKSLRQIEDSAVLAIERIGREVRGAESVNTGSSTLGAHPGRLVLEGLDDAGSPRTVEFYLSDGRLILKENGADVGPLTQADAVITNLVFRYFSGASSAGVRTEMTLESGTSTSYRSEKFYSTAVIR